LSGFPYRAAALSDNWYSVVLIIMDPHAVTSTHPDHPAQLPETTAPSERLASAGVDARDDAVAHRTSALSDIGDLGRLEGIIRSAMEAIITVDESQRIVIFNPMAEKLFGCAAADAIGGTLERFIPVRNRPGHSDKVRQFGVTGASERQLGRQRPIFGLRANGEEFPIEASISQLVDHKGRLFTVMLRDVTDRLKAEAELNASRNELRALSANLQTAREEEKARIARELHDDLGQRLTALKMDLALLESELEEHQGASAGQAGQADAAGVRPIGSFAEVPEVWRRHTHAMRALLDDTVQAVRRIAADLRPVMLDDLGLVAAMEWLANEWRSRFGIIVTLEVDPDGWNAVDPNAATAIFRIVQEALTNIARHANATRANVHLSRNGGSGSGNSGNSTGASGAPDSGYARAGAGDGAGDVTDVAAANERVETASCVLRISDNGTGGTSDSREKSRSGPEPKRDRHPLEHTERQPSLPQDTLPDAVDPHQPFGLIGMRERVRMLEGTMTIERPRTGGFIVHVILPLSMVDAVPGQRRAQAPLAPKRGKPTS